jgi:hypothetical protein
MGESQSFIEIVHPDPGVKVLQRQRQTYEILGTSLRSQVHVVGGLDRRSLDYGGESSDHEVLQLDPSPLATAIGRPRGRRSAPFLARPSGVPDYQDAAPYARAP